MPVARTVVASVSLLTLLLAACGDEAKLPLAAGTGPNPQLPEPRQTMLPTVQVAAVERWTDSAIPAAAPGLRAVSFAEDLDHPRWLYVLPNGAVLVAESNAPPKPEDTKGVKGFFMKMMMKRAGAGTPSANRITLLRDSDGDGKAELRRVFLEGLNSPFGMALVGNDLYVADTDAVRRFTYLAGETRLADSTGQKLVDLPAGPRNHHWTKSLVASRDGRFLYVGVGSNSDHGENGMAEEEERAAILEIERATGRHRVFADGLRNPVGLAFEPSSNRLWAVVNERDELGSDLVPDYLTSVRDGGFYGWPYTYYGQNSDPRVKEPHPRRVADTIRPDYALGAHVAPLGLAFGRDGALPRQFASGAFIGEHGSWNRKPPSGYKVIFVPFRDGKPGGEPVDVLTGFLDDEGKARGRPVGVALDRRGNLLVADDVGNRVWWVSADQRSAEAPR